MKKLILSFLVLLIISCASLRKPFIYVQNIDKYGSLENGNPEIDTLIQIKDKDGQLLGEGNVAIHEKEVSNIKVGIWKEYRDGYLYSTGEYKIGRYVECSAAGPVAQFYYYRSGNWIYYNQKGDSIFNLNFNPVRHHVNTNCEGGDSAVFGLVMDIPIEFWGEITFDKIYEMQKVSYVQNNMVVTMVPLNGIIHYEINEQK